MFCNLVEKAAKKIDFGIKCDVYPIYLVFKAILVGISKNEGYKAAKYISWRRRGVA